MNGRGRALDVSAASDQSAEKSGHPRPVLSFYTRARLRASLVGKLRAHPQLPFRVDASQPRPSRRLLEQAGCRLGVGGIYVCAGERLSLRFVTTAGAPHRARTLEIVQAQLRQVGVEVVPSYATSDPLFEQLLPSGNFDVALFLWQNKPAPEEVNSLYRCGAESNFSGYCSRLYTSDINQLERIVDPVRRAAVANRADRRMAEDVPILPLYQRPFTFGVRKPIQGFVPNGFGSILWSAENWWLAR